MTCTRVLVVALLTAMFGVPASAQELSRYRAYALDSSVAVVTTASGVRAADLRTLHTRPSKIQQIEWRAPYVLSRTAPADPVRDVMFSFYDDQLYQITVNYDPDRMEGLTNEDIIQSLSTTYGAPVALAVRPARGTARTPAPAPVDAAALARWEDATSLVTLTRNVDSRRFQLVFVSKALGQRARAAITEALRMDAMDAPQRERDLREKEATTARLKAEEARGVNKAGFRP